MHNHITFSLFHSYTWLHIVSCPRDCVYQRCILRVHCTRHVSMEKRRKKKKEERRKDPLAIPLRLTRMPRRTFESHCLSPTDVKQRFLFYYPLKRFGRSVYFIEFHVRTKKGTLFDRWWSIRKFYTITNFFTDAMCSLNVRSLTYFSGRLYHP